MATKFDPRAEARRAATRHKIPPPVFEALIDAESSWRDGVRSPAGAIGYTQLMPGTAASLGVDPFDARQNIEGGARYLAAQLKRFGNLRHALAAYNAGPGAVERYGGVPPYAETQRYVKRIMAALRVNPPPGQAPVVSAPLPSSRPPGSGPPAGAASPSNGRLPDIGAQTAFDNLGKISRGWSPESTLSSLVDAVSARADAPPAPAAKPKPTADPDVVAPTPVAAKPGRKPYRVAPLKTPLTGGSEFGVPDAEGAPSAKGGRYHAAKDWFAAAGAPVVSPESGQIVEVKPSRGNSGQIYGGVVKVKLASGEVVVFRHIDPVNIKVGEKVMPGMAIGRVTAWTGGSPHAHIEVWNTLEGGYRYENMQDPAVFFRR